MSPLATLLCPCHTWDLLCVLSCLGPLSAPLTCQTFGCFLVFVLAALGPDAVPQILSPMDTQSFDLCSNATFLVIYHDYCI